MLYQQKQSTQFHNNKSYQNLKKQNIGKASTTDEKWTERRMNFEKLQKKTIEGGNTFLK